MMLKKKGLSPVIATSLLIMLVLVLSVIIFLWMRGFVSEKISKAGTPAEQVCQNIQFEATLVSPAPYKLEIANRGNIPIFSFDIEKIYANGNSDIETFPFEVRQGESVRENFNIGTLPAKIMIYPVILGTAEGESLNKVFPCTDKGIEISL